MHMKLTEQQLMAVPAIISSYMGQQWGVGFGDGGVQLANRKMEK